MRSEDTTKMSMEDLKQYIVDHLRECHDFSKRSGAVPRLYRKGYHTALWHILSKIDHDEYMKRLEELGGE